MEHGCYVPNHIAVGRCFLYQGMALSARHPTPRLRARRIGRMRARVRRKPGSGLGAPAGRRSGAAPLTTLRGRAVAPRARRYSRAPARRVWHRGQAPSSKSSTELRGQRSEVCCKKSSHNENGIGPIWVRPSTAELRPESWQANDVVRRPRGSLCGFEASAAPAEVRHSLRPSQPRTAQPCAASHPPSAHNSRTLSLLRPALAHLDGAPSLLPLTRGSQLLLAERRASRAGAMDDPLG